MIRKAIYCSVAAFGLLSLASCSSEDVMSPAAGEGVTFTVELPGTINTRGSFGDGTDAGDRAVLDNLQWTVYEISGNGSTYTSVIEGGRQAFQASQTLENVSFPLVKGKTYQVAFYADDSNNGFVTYSDGEISVNYGNAASNVAAEDAFIGKSEVFTVTGAYNETVTLTRPFAQLNWGTDDKDADAVANLIPSLEASVEVTSGLFQNMNVISGQVSNPLATPKKFDAVKFAALPGQDFPVTKEDGSKYALVAMNYLLTGDGTIDCLMNFNNGLPAVVVNNAPVKVNYRTNIFGSLLTAPGNFNIIVDNNFIDNINNTVDVATANDLVAALASPTTKEVNVTNDLDLSGYTVAQLTFGTPKVINIPEGKTVALGSGNYLETNADLTITGGGKISNKPVTKTRNVEANETNNAKNLIIVRGGDLVLNGVTLENDPDWHMHGPELNSSAILYYNNANVTIRNSNIISGEFAVCAMYTCTGNVLIENSYIESTSSSAHNGKYWAYAMRLRGKEVVLDKNEVKGIQGAVSIESPNTKGVIKSGKYYTVNSAGKTDAFYALYVTNAAEVTIEGGEFSGANKRSNVITEGTSCVVSGDNDTHKPVGSIVIKGGKFSGKPYNHLSNKIYEPFSGLNYVSISEDPYIFQVK